MCYKKPGPRCSSHAEKRLTRLEDTQSEVITESKSVYKEYKSATEDFKATGSKADSIKAKKIRKNLQSLKEKKSSLDKEIKLAQRDFDGTQKGQKELRKQISEFDKENGSFDDFANLTNRLSAGRMLYSWRKNQLRLQEDQATTGKDLKERRGKFLTLSDRSNDGEEVVELDEDMVNAIINMNKGKKLVEV